MNPLIEATLDRLAALDPGPFLVITLYLNTEPDQHGRADFDPFVRKGLTSLAKTLPSRSPERESFARDCERIQRYLREDLRPSANGLALFACAGAGDFFEALQLDVPVPQNRLYLAPQPHLYTLALLGDRYPRHALLVADTNCARLFVVGIRRAQETESVQSPKTSRTQMGGWSQARYQRHVDHFRQQHAKEVISVLDRVVREEDIRYVFLAGDEVVLPMLEAEMPKHLAEKLIDVLRLDIRMPEHLVAEQMLEMMRLRDTAADAQKVRNLLDEYRAGGLAVVGREETLRVLEIGQADEIVLSASLKSRYPQEAEALVRKARQTGAATTFIEDASLLEEVEGVGAFLRYQV